MREGYEGVGRRRSRSTLRSGEGVGRPLLYLTPVVLPRGRESWTPRRKFPAPPGPRDEAARRLLPVLSLSLMAALAAPTAAVEAPTQLPPIPPIHGKYSD